MARAPAQLKLARNTGGNNATVGSRRGPNLRGRDGKSGGGARGSQERGPGRRERKNNTDSAVKIEDTSVAATLSDGMVRHLLRMQRSEWDRKPYEPKYAPGSFAANELIHMGRELCRGEAPPVKIWGMLEKRIGVVGMHNAEAHLKVRRVTDLDVTRLGERREHFETGDVEVMAKAPAVKAPAAKEPAAKEPTADAAVTQAAAASATASSQATVSQ